jgi:hypothetical protein
VPSWTPPSEETYAAYRAGYKSALTDWLARRRNWKSRAKAIDEAHDRYTYHPETTIAFIGVWDTVDAVGLPLPISDWFNSTIHQFKFPTRDLSDRVELAVHALAVDDERSAFTPVLWAADGDRVEQVWFAGVHSNVGGGYPKQGMSLVALEWLLQKADEKGLHIQKMDLDLIRGHASVDDKIYDPRANLGVFYHWAPRRIHTLCKKNGVPVKIHVSVLERLANGTGDYAPGNLPFGATVVPTLTGDPVADRFATRRAKAAQAVLAAAGKGRTDAAGNPKPDLLDEVTSAIKLGAISYWIFLLSGLGLLVGLLLGSVLQLAASLVGLLVAWALAWRADSTIAVTFSGFWHRLRPELRAAFRRAREEERAELERAELERVQLERAKLAPPPAAPPFTIGDPAPSA